MDIKLIGLERARTAANEYERPKSWESTSYLLTFCICGCAAPLQDVIDRVENLHGLALTQCSAQDDRYMVVVEAAGEDWRPVVQAVTKTLLTLPRSVTLPKTQELLGLDAMELEVGYGLVQMVDTGKGGDLLDRISAIRRQIALELGIVLPPVRIRDNMQLMSNEYHIKMRGQAVAKGQAYPGQFLAMDAGVSAAPIAGATRTLEPAFGLPAYWITEAQRENAEQMNYTVVEASAVVATHLTEVVTSHADELLTRQETSNLIAEFRSKSPALVAEVIPDLVKLGELQKILQNLLRERVPVRDLEMILETLGNHASATRDLEVLTESVRNALARTICRQYVDTLDRLWCVSVDPAVEELIVADIGRIQQDLNTAIPPQFAQRFVQNVASKTQDSAQGERQVVVLCSPLIRRAVRRMIEPSLPRTGVIAFNEVVPEINLEIIGSVGGSEVVPCEGGDQKSEVRNQKSEIASGV